MTQHTVNADTPKRPKKFRKHVCPECFIPFWTFAAFLKHKNYGLCRGKPISSSLLERGIAAGVFKPVEQRG